DRQSGGVGRGPAIGAKGVGVQVEDGAGTRLPGPVRLPLGVEELVQHARVFVHHEYVAIAAVGRAARRGTLDGSVGWDGVRAGVALVRVVERDVHTGLAGADDRVGDADEPTVPKSGAE